MHARCIQINWKGVSKSIGLSLAETIELFSDGRVSGELLQRVAIKQFSLISPKNCDFHDAEFPNTGHKIEIRLITSNGIQTRPSNQIGAKREFNEELYFQKLDSVQYFLFLDLRTISSNIPCYLLQSSTIHKFFQEKKLDKGGATRSFKTIATLLMESIKDEWNDSVSTESTNEVIESTAVLLEEIQTDSQKPLAASLELANELD